MKEFFEDQEVKFINSFAVYEMGIKQERMSDKYGEIIGNVIDNLICICLYPDNPTVNHWRERASGLCKRFIDLNIDPIKKNTYKNRLNILSKGVEEELDSDYSAILNHFKSVSIYYANRPNKHDRLTPYKPYKDIYKENKDKIISAINEITKLVAAQDYEKLIKYINKF